MIAVWYHLFFIDNCRKRDTSSYSRLCHKSILRSTDVFRYKLTDNYYQVMLDLRWDRHNRLRIYSTENEIYQAALFTNTKYFDYLQYVKKGAVVISEPNNCRIPKTLRLNNVNFTINSLVRPFFY